METQNSIIHSLGVLKIFCLLLLFWHHSYLPKPPVYLGARTCEVFFVSSGFLVAYNHAYKTDNCSWKLERIISVLKKEAMQYVAAAFFLLCLVF